MKRLKEKAFEGCAVVEDWFQLKVVAGGAGDAKEKADGAAGCCGCPPGNKELLPNALPAVEGAVKEKALAAGGEELAGLKKEERELGCAVVVGAPNRLVPKAGALACCG